MSHMQGLSWQSFPRWVDTPKQEKLFCFFRVQNCPMKCKDLEGKMKFRTVKTCIYLVLGFCTWWSFWLKSDVLPSPFCPRIPAGLACVYLAWSKQANTASFLIHSSVDTPTLAFWGGFWKMLCEAAGLGMTQRTPREVVRGGWSRPLRSAWGLDLHSLL